MIEDAREPAGIYRGEGHIGRAANNPRVWTLLIALLLGAGALCELYGLVPISRDVQAAADTTRAIAEEAKTKLAAGKHTVADWIGRATMGTLGDLDSTGARTASSPSASDSRCRRSRT